MENAPLSVQDGKQLLPAANEYEKQANDFLVKTNTIIKWYEPTIKKHFSNDEDERLVFQFTIKRGNRSYSSEFGASMVTTAKYRANHLLNNYLRNSDEYERAIKLLSKYIVPHFVKYPKAEAAKLHDEIKLLKINDFIPTAYDLLSTLTTYDPGTFSDFCAEFDYNNDSIQANKTYKAVMKEWQSVQVLFNDQEIALLSEIQ